MCNFSSLENAALSLWPQAAFSRLRPQLFTIWKDPKLANNLLIFFLTLSNQFFNSFTSTRTNVPLFASEVN